MGTNSQLPVSRSIIRRVAADALPSAATAGGPATNVLQEIIQVVAAQLELNVLTCQVYLGQ